jgi:SAM-dependent methyltransferase
MLKERIKKILKAILPVGMQRWLRIRKQRFDCRPPVGWVKFGSLRRIKPISIIFGFDRGLCIDRYYIEKFLSEHISDIKGHVLEIGDSAYTRKFGGDKVSKSDVLHVVDGNPNATIVADLTRDGNVPANTFDCIIFTQTLPFIYDVKAAIRNLYRILKPRGVLLVTFSGISQISRYDMDRWGDYWRFTTLSARKVFGEVFSDNNIQVTSYGNVLVAVSFLHGLASEELRQEELDYHDPDYEVLITVRAVKPEGV